MAVIFSGENPQKLYRTNLVEGHRYNLVFDHPERIASERIHTPYITYVWGKRVVIEEVRQSGNDLTLRVYVAKNPLPLVPLIYGIAILLSGIGVYIGTHNIKKVVEVGLNPIVLAGIAGVLLAWKG